MLDSSFAPTSPLGTTYEALPVGLYQCELIDIVLKDGTSYEGQPEKQLAFTWAVLKEGENYGRYIWQNANTKFVPGSKPSNLYRIITLIEGKQFTEEECADSANWLNAEYMNKLIGVQRMLVVGQKPKQNGDMKNTVDSMLPVEAKLPAFVPKEKK